MASYLDLIKNTLDARGVSCQKVTDEVLTVFFDGKNISKVIIVMQIDPENGNARLLSFSIGTFEQEQLAKALITCNSCNSHYRWVKFFIEEDNQIAAQIYAVLDKKTCGEECFQLLIRMSDILDKTYPVFMKAREL